MTRLYPDAKPKTIQNWASQVSPFAHDIQQGDLVILPLKTQPAIMISEVTSDYHFGRMARTRSSTGAMLSGSERRYRGSLRKDILFTLGAFMTICRVQRNNAEARIAAIQNNGWRPETTAAATIESAADAVGADDANLEELAHDR